MDQVLFDNYKYPFIEEFFDKIYIYKNCELKLSRLTCQMKFKNIKNLYHIIPYNITQLSLGEFDLRKKMIKQSGGAVGV